MTFLEKLENLMESFGIKNLYALSERSSIPYTTLKNFYVRGTDNIKLSTIKKLVSFFGCTIDYLARDEITDKSYGKYNLEEELNQNKLTKEEIDLIKVYRTLDKRGKITIDGLLSVESSILSNIIKLDKTLYSQVSKNDKKNNSTLILVPTEQLKKLDDEIESGKYDHLFEGDDSPI